ncbi:hypothetical protein WICPIJ_002741 [Wickerhamomyces pijperi]|uniref:Uncharacterized protein n=1 Tax=Wickerhamomyces pijperi TaxID=599730 RepID=A0A9P8QB41_WICPI|nr:hypothetical protein WICPIJ_002741 [Wickerhamomyces pijperi]
MSQYQQTRPENNVITPSWLLESPVRHDEYMSRNDIYNSSDNLPEQLEQWIDEGLDCATQVGEANDIQDNYLRRLKEREFRDSNETLHDFVPSPVLQGEEEEGEVEEEVEHTVESEHAEVVTEDEVDDCVFFECEVTEVCKTDIKSKIANNHIFNGCLFKERDHEDLVIPNNIGVSALIFVLTASIFYRFLYV